MKAPLLFRIWLLSYPVILFAELVIGANSLSDSVYNMLVTVGCGTFVLFASIAVYRHFFHQLRGFPGPKIAGITKFWHAYKCLPGQNYLVLDELHKKYGDFVRTGKISHLFEFLLLKHE